MDFHACAGSAPSLLRQPQPLQRGVASWNRDKFNLVKLKAAVDNAQREEEFIRQVQNSLHQAAQIVITADAFAGTYTCH